MTLAELPTGLVYLGNVPFDVRGLIQTRTRMLSDHFPLEVNGIAVGRKAHRIHVMHATMYEPTKSRRVAYYHVNYSDGTEDTFPIVYGRDMLDWHHTPGTDYTASKATLVWSGNNRQTRSNGRTLRLFKTVITPQRPDQLIESIDFVSNNTDSSPFLIAATIDRSEDPNAMYIESHSRAIANYVSNPNNLDFKTDLISSWKHLAAAATDKELAKAYTHLALDLETSLFSTVQPAATEIVAADRISNVFSDTNWHYWDLGGLPGKNWHLPEFDDSRWQQGKSPLGYGETRGIATKVGFGGDAGQKHATTFFRKTFRIEQPQKLYRLGITADDGAAVYLNGERIATVNLRDKFDHNTFTVKVKPEPIAPETYWIPAAKFTLDNNTLAVEIHQASGTSSDIRFDLTLDAIDTTVDYDQIDKTMSKHDRQLPAALRAER